jgi:hypothetical protein
VLLGLPVFANDIFTSWAKAVMDLLFPGEAFGVDTVLVNKYTFLGEACFSRHLDCARACASAEASAVPFHLSRWCFSLQDQAVNTTIDRSRWRRFESWRRGNVECHVLVFK